MGYSWILIFIIFFLFIIYYNKNGTKTEIRDEKKKQKREYLVNRHFNLEKNCWAKYDKSKLIFEIIIYIVYRASWKIRTSDKRFSKI